MKGTPRSSAKGFAYTRVLVITATFSMIVVLVAASSFLGARAQQGAIDVNGGWRTSEGDDVIIEQTGQHVKGTFVSAGDCAGGEKRDFFIQGIEICAYAADYVDNEGSKCADYATGQWRGTLKEYEKGNVYNETVSILFSFNEERDGTIKGAGRAKVESAPQTMSGNPCTFTRKFFRPDSLLAQSRAVASVTNFTSNCRPITD